jgi:glucose-6-phosphate 1-dehydrogenase
VDPESGTETFAAMRLRLHNWRWAGTPFYLRTGKRLPLRVTEIAMVFRDPPHLPLPIGAAGPPPNELVLSVQPNEGATLQVAAKVPGTSMELRPVQMDFRYGETFLRESPEAYERLLHDAMKGDAALFTRADEVETQWRVVDPVLAAWAEGLVPLEPYHAGTEGPSAANVLMTRDGRRWREL